MSKPMKTSIGGQALIEGIMMRGPEKTCLSVRMPDGTLYSEVQNTMKPLFAKIPILRGAVSMVQSLMIGYKAMMRSADLSMTEEEKAEEQTAFDRWLEKCFGEKTSSVIGIVGGVAGAVLAVALFMILPTFLTGLLASAAPMSGIVMAFVEGILKMGIFIGYLYLITFMKEIRRVFEYHGAEHKIIACYEAGEELTPENAKKHSRLHPRCGTSFMFIVLFLSIIVFSFVPWTSTFLRALTKLLCLPLNMGIAYEILKFSGKSDGVLARILATPGLWIQRLTTFEPDDSQLEVAIASMKAVIPEKPETASL